jgi:hypothetical protein
LNPLTAGLAATNGRKLKVRERNALVVFESRVICNMVIFDFNFRSQGSEQRYQISDQRSQMHDVFRLPSSDFSLLSSILYDTKLQAEMAVGYVGITVLGEIDYRI